MYKDKTVDWFLIMMKYVYMLG